MLRFFAEFPCQSLKIAFQAEPLPEERPWRGNDKLLICCGVNSAQVRYLASEPVRRSWDFSFKPTLTAEELFDWLISRQ